MTTQAAASSPSRRNPYRLLVLTELRLAWRYPVGLIFGVGLPMMLLIIFGSIPSLTQPSQHFGGLSFFTVYTPTLMVLVLLVLGLLSLPTQMAGYREQGVLRRMSTTPVAAPALLGAQVAVNLILAAFALAMLLGVGAGAFNLVLPTQFGWLILSILFTVAAMFGIGLFVSALAGTPQVANAIGSALFYPFAFFSGLYVPLVSLNSGVIDDLAKALPSGAAFNALHASLAGHFPGWAALGVLLAYAVVFSGAAVHWFRWDIERARSRRGGLPALVSRSITVPAEVTGEQVSRALREGLSPRYEVRPGMKIKGLAFGMQPAGTDVTMVTTGMTGLWRAEVAVMHRRGNTHIRIRPGGDLLLSTLGVARKVRHVLLRDLALVPDRPPSTSPGIRSREDKQLA